VQRAAGRRRRPALAHARAHGPQVSGVTVFTHALPRTADEFIAAGEAIKCYNFAASVRRGVADDAAGALKATARKWASGVARDIGECLKLLPGCCMLSK